MCWYLKRWFICPLHSSVPKSDPGIPTDPGRSWLAWNHGEPVDPGTVKSFNLEIFPNHYYARHKMTSKARCAAWDTESCDKAPHETFHLMHWSICPECSGCDRFMIAQKPYFVARQGHETLIKTADDHENMKKAVDYYWHCFLQTQSTMMKHAFGGDDGAKFVSPGSVKNQELEETYRLLAIAACTNDFEHICSSESVPDTCQHCSSTEPAPAHNLLRSLLTQEAATIKHNLGNAAVLDARVKILEKKGFIKRLRTSRRRENNVAQEWRFNDNYRLSLPLDVDTEAMISLAITLNKFPDMVEDVSRRQYTHKHSWSDTIENRLRFALRCLKLIGLDPGVNVNFFQLLFGRHIRSLMLPWPQDQDNLNLFMDTEALLKSLMRQDQEERVAQNETTRPFIHPPPAGAPSSACRSTISPDRLRGFVDSPRAKTWNFFPPSQPGSPEAMDMLENFPQDPHPETAKMIAALDNCDFSVATVLENNSKHEDSLIDALKKRRDVIRSNAISVQARVERYLDQLEVMSISAARSIDTVCVVCSHECFGDKVPKHMSIVVSPCCAKPVHRACLQRAVMSPDAEHVTCPLCDTGLTEHRWHGLRLRSSEIESSMRGFIRRDAGQ